MNHKIILVPSRRMDENKKSDRDEHSLIRMGERARVVLGLAGEKEVTVWSENKSGKSKTLKIFQAFSGDLEEMKQQMTNEEYARVAFVTTSTHKLLCGEKSKTTQKYAWLSDSVEELMVGTDPEFGLFKNGRLEFAGYILPDKTGQLGYDGAFAELRPNPSAIPEQVVKNMVKLLKSKETSVIKDYDWKACCHVGGHHCGGHIHIGIPMTLLKTNIPKCDWAVPLTRMIDSFVAVPLMILDPKQESITRRKRYGYVGEFRYDWADHIEHRTFSGMWMLNPNLATAVIGATKAVAEAFFKAAEGSGYDQKYMTNNQGLADTLNRDVKFPILSDLNAYEKLADLKNKINNYDIQFDKDTIDGCHNKLRRLPNFNKYSEYIDRLMTFVADFQSGKPENDIKKSWTGSPSTNQRRISA